MLYLRYAGKHRFREYNVLISYMEFDYSVIAFAVSGGRCNERSKSFYEAGFISVVQTIQKGFAAALFNCNHIIPFTILAEFLASILPMDGCIVFNDLTKT